MSQKKYDPADLKKKLEAHKARKSQNKDANVSTVKESTLEKYDLDETRLEGLRTKVENLKKEIENLERKQANRRKYLEGLEGSTKED